ncbi:MAG: hypothetical protein ABIN89_11495 [Chitinophagaceae bacterium]
MRRLGIIICIVFFYQFSFAQEEVVFDTDSLSLRNFETATINNYKADPKFQYEEVIQPSRSLWARFWAWFWQKISSLFGNETSQDTFSVFIIILSVSILVFFIVKLTGMSNMGLFGKKNKEEGLGYSVTEDNIHSINFDAAIEQAMADKNFRFAVRLLYLQTLKNLTDIGLINWQVNKTNIAYVEELNGNEYQQSFRTLTLQFENNWYGYVPIEENEFQGVINHFRQFNQKLS